jgi:hypothetical protein
MDMSYLLYFEDFMTFRLRLSYLIFDLVTVLRLRYLMIFLC